MPLISNYKLCQDPNTKNSRKRIQVERENGSCVVCERGEASPIYL
jgi:hypothetical protein